MVNRAKYPLSFDTSLVYLTSRSRSQGILKVGLYMYFEVTLNLTYGEITLSNFYDVIEHMLYYHTGPYLAEYLQCQDHFGPSEIGSKLCSKVPVMKFSLGRKWNQALM